VLISFASSDRFSPARGRARCTTASAAETPRAKTVGSRTSPRIGIAPKERTFSAFRGDRTSPTTSWPAATSWRTISDPMNPPAPVTKTCIQSQRFETVGLDNHDLRTDLLPAEGPCLDALNSVEVVRDQLPGLAVVAARVQLTGGRAHIHARGVPVVGPQPVPEDGEPCVFLREALRVAVPPLPAVRRPEHRHRALRRHAVVVPDEGHGVRGAAVVRVGHHREPEGATRALRDGEALLHQGPPRIAPVPPEHPGMVLLIHDRGVRGI